MFAFAVTACLLSVVLILSLSRHREPPKQDDADSPGVSRPKVVPDPKVAEAIARRKRKLAILRRRAAKEELANPARDEWIYVDPQGRPVAYLTSKQTVTITYNGTTKITVTNTTTTVTTSNDAYKTSPRKRGSQAAATREHSPQRRRGLALGSSGSDGILLNDDGEAEMAPRSKATSRG